MILQALNHHYERLRDDPQTDIPLLGFGNEKVHFALVLNEQGRLLEVKDLRDRTRNKPVPATLTVPVIGKKRAVDITPNFMWDNSGYVLGRDAKGNGVRSLKCFEAFKKLHHSLGESVDDRGMTAVLRFLDLWNPEDCTEMEHWEEIAGANLVFQLDGESTYIHERPSIREAWARHCVEEGSEVVATCLVTGVTGPIARLHPPIKGVQGAQSSGAGIISFNLEAFRSYNKRQNFNAPVCESVAFGYTTALNHLLRFESGQKIRIGDATTVFWTERASPIEGFMSAILDPGSGSADAAEDRMFL